MPSEVVALAATIVSAYVSRNHVQQSNLPELISKVHGSLSKLAKPVIVAEEVKPGPAVPIHTSVSHDVVICLECGKHLKSLSRHIMSKHDLTPENYRAKWGLPPNYTMVAPSYAEVRAKIAREMRLGRRPERSSQTASEGQSSKAS